MRYLLRFSHNGKYTPPDKRNLSRVAFEEVKSIGADIGNLRVSRTAIELDLLIDSQTKLEAAKHLLQEKLGKILTVRRLDEPIQIAKVDAIRDGLVLFNEERYWESHEALEAAWRVAKGPEKEVLQGIILLAAALVHLQKNEQEIALSMMTRAVSKLGANTGAFFGVEVGDVLKVVQKMISEKAPGYFMIESHQD